MELLPTELPNAKILYLENFISENEANQYFTSMLKETPWRQDFITVFGKTYPQPRKTCLYASNSKPYSYSNITMQPLPLTKDLTIIKERIENRFDVKFTTCLLNLYENGNHSNGWHADNEKALGINPIIASVSFGGSRWFHLKHRYNKELRYKIELKHGSLLLMSGETQHFWLHQIPKTKKIVMPRINLTYRLIN
ncbi:alpha-ketoglutarate-dependent dioxygenase AlkB family protein [Ascidiimonas sp. W6]|uniref:alpha-ketoglutarate-dependent dioxygenase AlkB family protein n=1 Tax=Ascidiimonas meishanensis TaxID=3128903 RepID=UPI0030EE6182